MDRVHVPGGRHVLGDGAEAAFDFLYGSFDGTNVHGAIQPSESNLLQRASVLSSPFQIDRIEASAGAVGAFCRARGRALPASIVRLLALPGGERLPASGLTWTEAADCARWATFSYTPPLSLDHAWLPGFRGVVETE